MVTVTVMAKVKVMMTNGTNRLRHLSRIDDVAEGVAERKISSRKEWICSGLHFLYKKTNFFVCLCSFFFNFAEC